MASHAPKPPPLATAGPGNAVFGYSSLLASPVQSVYNGQVCLGHIVSRGKCGFEAYDTDDISLGIFPDQQTAAAAISRRAAP
jgi:hypothetical protein